jgi:hypothetical protein
MKARAAFAARFASNGRSVALTSNAHKKNNEAFV